MSEENVEIVRRYIEGWNEAPELPAWVAGIWESDGDYYPVRGFPEARPCHGREEIADFLAGLREPWNYRVAIKDARAIGMIASWSIRTCERREARAARPWKGTSRIT